MSEGNNSPFSHVLFSFLPLFWPPLFLTFSRHLFALAPPSKSTLFCSAKGRAQRLETGSFRMDLSTKFGKETPSRNLREKRSDKALSCSCESWLAFLILEPSSPSAISCGFPAMGPPKTAFFCRKVHFSAGKCIFLQESTFLPAGNCIFLPENLFFCSLLEGAKNHEW